MATGQAVTVATRVAGREVVATVAKSPRPRVGPGPGPGPGREQRRLEVVAEEVAPSLQWATATVAEVERRTGGDAPVTDEPPF